MQMNDTSFSTPFAEIDWNSWSPVDTASLLFVIKDNRILLIQKRRGLGAGKINGPGGRLEPDETIQQCAIREVQEELLVTPLSPVQRGILRFQFTDGYSLHCTVFTSNDLEGEPQQTEEAIPLWTPLDAIPYDKMWADDIYWMPKMLEGFNFDGNFLFAGDTMLGKAIEFSPSEST